MMELYNNIKTESGINTTGSGQYYFEVQDNNNIDIILYSESLFKQHLLDEKDREELKKIIKWLNTKERIEWIESTGFKMTSLYLYIRLKASQDKDFLKWWQEYDFKVELFLYNSRKWYR